MSKRTKRHRAVTDQRYLDQLIQLIGSVQRACSSAEVLQLVEHRIVLEGIEDTLQRLRRLQRANMGYPDIQSPRPFPSKDNNCSELQRVSIA